jgi:hypothetical protein
MLFKTEHEVPILDNEKSKSLKICLKKKNEKNLPFPILMVMD